MDFEFNFSTAAELNKGVTFDDENGETTMAGSAVHLEVIESTPCAEDIRRVFPALVSFFPLSHIPACLPVSCPAPCFLSVSDYRFLASQSLDAQQWDRKKTVIKTRDGDWLHLSPGDVVLVHETDPSNRSGWRLFLVDEVDSVTDDLIGRAIYSHVHFWPSSDSASFVNTGKTVRM